MKVTISPDGGISVEVTNGETKDVVGLIRSLQQQQADSAATDNPSINPSSANTATLNAKQYETWEYLCENDCVIGVSVNAVARHFGITDSAASQRMINLVRNGYAARVTTGRYRAALPE